MADNFNLCHVALIETKQGYNIFLNEVGNQLKLVSPIVKSPFGVETFGKDKHIINIELTGYKNSNSIYNFYVQLRNIDKFFKNIIKNDRFMDYELPEDLAERLEGKTYVPCLKCKNGFDPLLRVFMKKAKKNIITTVKSNKEDIVDKNLNVNLNLNLKGEYGSFSIRLNTFWITNDSYGLTWILDEVIIQ